MREESEERKDLNKLNKRFLDTHIPIGKSPLLRAWGFLFASFFV